jgi:isoleucyl-tRNA synthetase
LQIVSQRNRIYADFRKVQSTGNRTKWYNYWLENKYFHSEPNDKPPYTVVIPPPNVTGILHMGHMLNNTIQDVLVRRARMQGLMLAGFREQITLPLLLKLKLLLN